MNKDKLIHFLEQCRINLEKAAADFAKNGEYQEAAYAKLIGQAYDLLIERIKKMLDEEEQEEQGGKVQ